MKNGIETLYERWKYARFRTWLIVLFLMFSIIPLSLIGVVVFRLSKAELTEQAEEHFLQSAKSTSEILDNELEDIEEFSLKMNVDSRVYEIFQNLDTENPVELEYASNQIAEILLNYLPWNNSVYSTHLVTSYYRFGEKDKNFYPEKSFVESEMIQTAKEANGKLVWIPTYDYIEMFHIKKINQNNLEYKRLFSAVRKLNPGQSSSGRIQQLSTETENPYLVVNYTEENLRGMLERYAGRENEAEYFVMTKDGSLVCSSNVGSENRFENITMEELGIRGETGSIRKNLETEEYIIAYAESKVTGWYVIAAQPIKMLTQKILNKLMCIIFLWILLMVVLTFVVSFFISKKFNKKIYKPLNMIENVGIGNFDSEIQYNPRDEFSFFYAKLNEMNQNLKNLVHENYEVKLQKRDTEIMSLNIQMNPHFLYNSLNIIHWMCMGGESQKAGAMLLELTRMLQYTSRNGDLLVPFHSDLDWLKRYLSIMEKRYEEKFQVSIDIPEELGNLKVPKLFLQPFVENAIVHAFKDYQEEGELRIFVETQEKDIVFCVEDNGCGISQERIGEILGRKNDSIGIHNTDKRLRMIYGEKYGISISSQVGEGTVVFIKIPDNREL